MIKAPAIKFIGNKEMVIPIIDKGYLLSHKDYINFYFPEVIEIIDYNGILIKFQKAELLKGIQWKSSLINASLMWKIQPILIEKPEKIDVLVMKEKVCKFIEKASSKKGILKEEKIELIGHIQNCVKHSEIIDIVNSVSYWK